MGLTNGFDDIGFMMAHELYDQLEVYLVCLPVCWCSSRHGQMDTLLSCNHFHFHFCFLLIISSGHV